MLSRRLSLRHRSFLPILLVFQACPLLLKRRAPNDLLGALQLRWIEAELLHKVSFGRNGVTKDEFIQILGEQFGDRRFVAALGEFITRHGGGAAIPKAKEARSGLVFDTARKQ